MWGGTSLCDQGKRGRPPGGTGIPRSAKHLLGDKAVSQGRYRGSFVHRTVDVVRGWREPQSTGDGPMSDRITGTFPGAAGPPVSVTLRARTATSCAPSVTVHGGSRRRYFPTETGRDQAVRPGAIWGENEPMERALAFELRDRLLDELGGVMRSADAPPTSAPSIGVFVQGDKEGWSGRYGLSILLPEDAGVRYSAWTDYAVKNADDEANVVTVSPLRAYGCPSAGHLTPGCSVSGGPEKIAGTLGAVVRRGDTLGVLSNRHVLAPSAGSQPGDVVYHPGLLDHDQPHSAAPFGTLLDFVPLSQNGAHNVADAAIAVCTDDGQIVCPRPGQPGYVSKAAGPEEEVDWDEPQEKVGRTTRVTQGLITRIGHTSWVDYGPWGIMPFRDVIVIDDPAPTPKRAGPFSAAGDSGSLIYGATSTTAAPSWLAAACLPV
jgi:hypothetical protein